MAPVIQATGFVPGCGSLEQTWWNACEVARMHGTTLECATYLSAAVNDPDPERWRKVQAEIRARLEQAKRGDLVKGYEEMRMFWGETNFRRVDFN